jgi:hypothetical protein
MAQHVGRRCAVEWRVGYRKRHFYEGIVESFDDEGHHVHFTADGMVKAYDIDEMTNEENLFALFRWIDHSFVGERIRRFVNPNFAIGGDANGEPIDGTIVGWWEGDGEEEAIFRAELVASDGERLFEDLLEAEAQAAISAKQEAEWNDAAEDVEEDVEEEVEQAAQEEAAAEEEEEEEGEAEVVEEADKEVEEADGTAATAGMDADAEGETSTVLRGRALAAAVRARMASVGASQASIANQLGIHKVYLSCCALGAPPHTPPSAMLQKPRGQCPEPASCTCAWQGCATSGLASILRQLRRTQHPSSRRCGCGSRVRLPRPQRLP